MQIIVLDGHVLNPGDLSWSALEAIGLCTVYDRTPPEQTLARATPGEIVLTNKTVLSRDTIRQLPRLKYIGVLATGYNIVEIEAARDRGVPVTNVPDYATMSVVQMVFAHLTNLSLHVAEHSAGVMAGRWTQSIDFAYWDFPLVELAGLTIGLVGFGRIGRATAEVARAMGMKVLVHDVVPPPGDCPDFCVGGLSQFSTRSSENGTVPFAKSAIEFVSLEDLFRHSDVVSLHCPLTQQTHKLVNAERLALMKPTAYLINTGRGPLVDEAALAAALNSGRIAGAGVDVLSTEPPPADNPLLSARNCHITPHVAWATRAARERLLGTVVANVQAYLAGKPQNVVN